MTSSRLAIAFILSFMLFQRVSSQKELNFKNIESYLKKLCLSQPTNNTEDQNVVTCKITFEYLSCWEETPAGETAAQPCPFLLFSTTDNIYRRCDEQGKWLEANSTNCRRLKPKEAVNTGKQTSNVSVTADEKDDSLTHAQRVQKVYVACSWVAFFVLLPTFILICVIMRRNDRFTLHKNLIVAFILRIFTLFIYYYGKMGEKDYNTTVCNAFWLLNRYFAASEITWMLTEGIFLVRTLVYPFDNESYFWYFFLFGWGFSGVLTFCVYLPYVQFKIARVSESCWVSHSHTNHMLVLYVPLTIMLLINFGFAGYVIQMLAKKLKNSQSSHMNTVKKSAKAVVILIALLGFIYLLTFYQPGNNPGYEYFVAVVYPIQGIMVCIFCVFLSMEFRESFRRHWMKWRYGILIETNPYSATHDIEPGPSGEQGTSASVLGTESSDEMQPRVRSIASLRENSRPPSAQLPKQLPEKFEHRTTQMSLLSRSSDLTKYRLKKVEPEPVKPLRVQSAGPEAWCPPTLEAATAWQELDSSENQNESSLSQGVENNGFSKSEGDLSHLGSQVAIETKTSPQAEPETDPEELSYTAPEDTRESLISNSKGEFSFSSQLFEQDTRPSTAEFSEETTGACASGGESLTAGASMSEDAEPSTSNEEAGASSRGERFWKRIQEIAAQRRRSRLEHNRVLSTEGDSLDFHPKYAEKHKEADQYRLAWIASILKRDKARENESNWSNA